MKSREQYYKILWMYLKRREVLRKRIGKRKEGYGDSVERINATIKVCRTAITRIDNRNKKVRELVRGINDFFDVDIHSSKINYKHRLARNCYYKYGIETGIEGNRLSQFIGKPKLAACRARLSFTRKFATSPKDRHHYHTFKDYITQ